MKALYPRQSILILLSLFFVSHTYAQGDAKASAKIDAAQITVGDQVRVFLEAQNNTKQGKLQWAVIPDTFNKLEVVEKGKIDTLVQGDIVTYKQRLLVSGYDSGVYKIPAFVFTVIPNSGTLYTVQTDSFPLLVQTVAVDTTQPFKGIKGIMLLKSNWLDYLWYIIGAIVFIVLLIAVVIYFVKNKKAPAPVIVPLGPQETLQEKTLRLINELEQQQLWQKGQVKEYYVELTDILRNYIEARFRTAVLELTTDELLDKVRMHKELMPYHQLLGNVLYTADLAKFAKAQPLPQEHVDAMEYTRQFVSATKPVIIETPTQQQPKS